VKRVYDPATPMDGQRVLVDRLWPRGLSKTALRANAWLKEIAPSDTLRHWFAHDPAKWPEFVRRYHAELDACPQSWRPLLEAARRGPITLRFSARDAGHNNAVALRAFLLVRARTSYARTSRTRRAPAGDANRWGVRSRDQKSVKGTVPPIRQNAGACLLGQGLPSQRIPQLTGPSRTTLCSKVTQPRPNGLPDSD
jgi:uncharacterized protein YeaO (DUF488 family)